MGRQGQGGSPSRSLLLRLHRCREGNWFPSPCRRAQLHPRRGVRRPPPPRPASFSLPGPGTAAGRVARGSLLARSARGHSLSIAGGGGFCCGHKAESWARAVTAPAGARRRSPQRARSQRRLPWLPLRLPQSPPRLEAAAP